MQWHLMCGKIIRNPHNMRNDDCTYRYVEIFIVLLKIYFLFKSMFFFIAMSVFCSCRSDLNRWHWVLTQSSHSNNYNYDEYFFFFSFSHFFMFATRSENTVSITYDAKWPDTGYSSTRVVLKNYVDHERCTVIKL